MVENASNKSIRTLRCDNGGEFVKKKIEAYLSKHGIQHQNIIPYTPQQNSVVERKNKTLVKMARCMLYYFSIKNNVEYVLMNQFLLFTLKNYYFINFIIIIEFNNN